MNVTKGIYDRLAGVSAVTNLLATYQGAPAIFTSFPVPRDASRPYIVTAGNLASVPFDTVDALANDVIRDVACYDDNDGSALAIEALAAQIKSALHRQPMTIPDADHVMTILISGPVVAPTDASLVGRVLTFRIVAKES